MPEHCPTPAHNSVNNIFVRFIYEIYINVKIIIDNIVINTVIPVLFSYGHYHNEMSYKYKALRWLEQMKAEINNITKSWVQVNITNKTAFDSQSLIELKTHYCDKKRCLDCAIGNALLKKPAKYKYINLHGYKRNS